MPARRQSQPRTPSVPALPVANVTVVMRSLSGRPGAGRGTIGTVDAPAGDVVRNWCGTAVLAEPGHVRDADRGVAEFLRTTTARVQPLGRRYSYPDLIDATDGVALLGGQDARVTIAPDRRTVTVSGAATLTQVYDTLRAAGLRLPGSPPVITVQTVAGAIATGTHSQGLHNGTLGDAAVAVRWIDATGRESSMTAEHPDFGAFRQHVGCLGWIAEVTFAVVDNETFTCEKFTTDAQTLRDHYVGWNRAAAYAKSWWFVHEDRAHTWSLTPGVPGEFSGDGEGEGSDEFGAILDEVSARLAADTKDGSATAAPQRCIARFRDYHRASGDLIDLLRNGIPAPQINMEIGVGLDAFDEAMILLRDIITTHDFHLHYPVILRSSGPSQAWLNPAYDKEVCHFGFVVFQAADGTVPAGSTDLLARIQRALAELGGLPHWGKYFDAGLFDFTVLPRWRDFQAVRARLDPTGRFFSPRLRRVFDAES